MRATLIYNAGAGGAAGVTSDALQEALVDAGYTPVYHATTCEDDLEAALAQPSGLVVAAGGDGTVRAVATRLVRRPPEERVPLAIAPLGTANNISGTLGLGMGPVDAVRGLANPRRRPFDVGLVRGPWGEDYFLEAAGFGLFASVMAAYDPEAGKSPLRAVQSIVSTLSGFAAPAFTLRLNGERVEQQFLLVEVMNTAATGPRLRLAPDANPGDGCLDIVLVEESSRVGLAAYLSGVLTGRLGELPNVTTLRAHEVHLEWDGSPVHLDAEVRPRQPPRDAGEPAEGATPEGRDPERPRTEQGGAVHVSVLAGALEVWLPEEVKTP